MRIVFVTAPGTDHFLRPIIASLATTHDVRVCCTEDHVEIAEAAHWSDVVWLEWLNELTIAMSRTLPILRDRRVVCRLHSYEAFNGAVDAMDWSLVDDLVFVAPHIRDAVVTQAPSVPVAVSRLHVIANGVDVDRYTFRERTPGFALGCLGSINYKKGPLLLFHAFRELVAHDDRYQLSIAGRVQDVRYAMYLDQMSVRLGIKDNITLDGWVEDVDGWLSDKQYVVSTSVLEAHPVGVMEAMAAGVKPVIHRHVGASGVFPEEILWDTIPQFVEMVSSATYASSAYRELVGSRYGMARQMSAILGMFDAAPVAPAETVER